MGTLGTRVPLTIQEALAGSVDNVQPRRSNLSFTFLYFVVLLEISFSTFAFNFLIAFNSLIFTLLITEHS